MAGWDSGMQVKLHLAPHQGRDAIDPLLPCHVPVRLCFYMPGADSTLGPSDDVRGLVYVCCSLPAVGCSIASSLSFTLVIDPEQRLEKGS